MSGLLGDLLGKTITVKYTRKGRYGVRFRRGYLNKVNEEYIELLRSPGFFKRSKTLRINLATVDIIEVLIP